MQVNFKDLQEYLAQHYAQHSNGVETSLFMKLVEEVGEVAEVLNQRSGRKSQDKDDLDKELVTEIADIIHYVVALAAINHLDLTKTILEKDKAASIKYGRTMNLTEFIQQKHQ